MLRTKESSSLSGKARGKNVVRRIIGREDLIFIFVMQLRRTVCYFVVVVVAAAAAAVLVVYVCACIVVR